MKPEIKKYLCLTIDPVHVGAGGYRLGRVDNTIVRDPATDLPKIPGTSIAGSMREYYRLYLQENNGSEGDVSRIFGDEGHRGLLRFYDGQIILFPVPSVKGTVWVTTAELLKYWCDVTVDDEKEIIAVHGMEPGNINLGWLYFMAKEGYKELPSEVKEWAKRILAVPDSIFPHLVNDNLEIRTSVRIDPETGTAVSGALFTYEAIPRGTVIGFEIGFQEEFDIGKLVPYFRCLGIGGMGTRGFGRIEIRERGDNEP